MEGGVRDEASWELPLFRESGFSDGNGGVSGSPGTMERSRGTKDRRTLPGQPRSAPPGLPQHPGCSPSARGAPELAARMLTGWGEGGGKDTEREKLKDFNTNNLQGVFCKQNGGQGARSTCLSALPLIVWGRRVKALLYLCAPVPERLRRLWVLLGDGSCSKSIFAPKPPICAAFASFLSHA